MSPAVKVLVLGAAGMLGHTVFRYFARDARFAVTGTVRSADSCALLPAELRGALRDGVDVDQWSTIERAFGEVRPDVVINLPGGRCIVVDSKGAVYAADTYGQRIQKFVPAQTRTSVQ